LHRSVVVCATNDEARRVLLGLLVLVVFIVVFGALSCDYDADNLFGEICLIQFGFVEFRGADDNVVGGGTGRLCGAGGGGGLCRSRGKLLSAWWRSS